MLAGTRVAMIRVRKARIVALNLAVSNHVAQRSAALIIAARKRRARAVPSPAAPNFDAAEEPILLPGESLAKYRGKPIAASASPVVEQESSSKISEATENSRLRYRDPTSPSQPARCWRRRSPPLHRWTSSLAARRCRR